MKVTVTDSRYGDQGVTVIDNGDYQRRKHRTDNRVVEVTLEVGLEMPDMICTADAYTGRLFRPKTIRLCWHRGDKRHLGGGWKDPFINMNGDTIVDRDDDWGMNTAYVSGPNVLKSGELGGLVLSAGMFKNPPELVATLIAEHDPKVNGWPLDGVEV